MAEVQGEDPGVYTKIGTTEAAMKRRILLAMLAFLFIVPVGIVSAEEGTIQDSLTNAPSLPLFSKEGDGGSLGLSPDSEKKEQKEHKHDEGMHGMVMGHHSTGWAIMIGVVIVAMMAAMVF